MRRLGAFSEPPLLPWLLLPTLSPLFVVMLDTITVHHTHKVLRAHTIYCVFTPRSCWYTPWDQIWPDLIWSVGTWYLAGSLIWYLGYLVSCAWCQVPCMICDLVSGYLVSCARYLVSCNMWSHVPGNSAKEYFVPGTWFPSTCGPKYLVSC